MNKKNEVQVLQSTKEENKNFNAKNYEKKNSELEILIGLP